MSAESESFPASPASRPRLSGLVWALVVFGALSLPIGAVAVFAPRLGVLLALGSTIFALALYLRMREAACPNCERPIRSSRRSVTCPGCKHRLRFGA